VTVVRDKKEQTLTITLPARKDSGMVIDESMDEDEYDLTADTELAIDRAGSALARLTPEVMEKAEKDMAQASEALEKAQDDCKDSIEDEQENIESQVEDQQEKLRDQQKMMQDREQKLQHEMKGEWTEI
jgi:hypothetical protein